MITEALPGLLPAGGLTAGFFGLLEGSLAAQSASEKSRGLNGINTTMGSTYWNSIASSSDTMSIADDKTRTALNKLTDRLENENSSLDNAVDEYLKFFTNRGIDPEMVIADIGRLEGSGVNFTPEMQEFTRQFTARARGEDPSKGDPLIDDWADRYMVSGGSGSGLPLFGKGAGSSKLGKGVIGTAISTVVDNVSARCESAVLHIASAVGDRLARLPELIYNAVIAKMNGEDPKFEDYSKTGGLTKGKSIRNSVFNSLKSVGTGFFNKYNSAFSKFNSFGSKGSEGSKVSNTTGLADNLVKDSEGPITAAATNTGKGLFSKLAGGIGGGESGAVTQDHGIGKGMMFNSESGSENLTSIYDAVAKHFEDTIGIDKVSGTLTDSFMKQVEQMQSYSLEGNTAKIWKLKLDINQSSGVAGPVVKTMYDFTKTIYAMLSTVTGVLMPIQATMAGVNSALQYMTGEDPEDSSTNNSTTTSAQQAATSKSTSYSNKVGGALGRIKKSFKKVSEGASGSGLFPLFGIGGGRTVKDTKGKETEASPSVSSGSNLNLDYGGNDTDHPFTDQIWSYLKSIGFSDHAAAGILGNVRAESGGDYAPYRVQYRFSDKLKGDSSYADIKKKYENWGVDFSSYNSVDETLTKNVDGGNINKEWFRRPRGEGTQDGYGIVQFTFPPYKDQLYEKAKEKKTSVGNSVRYFNGSA